MTGPTAHDFHTGDFQANATPGEDAIAFADDARIPFESQP
jgi:hypothetical protein